MIFVSLSKTLTALAFAGTLAFSMPVHSWAAEDNATAAAEDFSFQSYSASADTADFHAAGESEENAVQAVSATITAGAQAAKKTAADTAAAVSNATSTVSPVFFQGVAQNAAAALSEQENGAQEEEKEEAAAEAANPAPASALRSLGTFKLTGYCPCYRCSEGWGRTTSTGAVARSSHTIAVDPRVIPYGTKVMINGVVYTAEDRGGGVKGHHIDIFFDTHAQTRQIGTSYAEVFLVE